MRTQPPVLPGAAADTHESPADRALELLLAGERDAALRWAAAILRDDPTMPTAALVAGRALREAGRLELAREACAVAVERAIELESLALAVAAAREAEAAGAAAAPLLDAIAEAFASGSPRLGRGASPPAVLPAAADFHPLASVLSGAALYNKAAEFVHAAKKALDASPRAPLGTLPLFSALDRPSLRRLVEALVPEWVRGGQFVLRQGEPGHDAYWVARGELEASRTTRAGERIVLARLGAGTIFGEMALLSRTPRVGSVEARRASIVVRISRATLDTIAGEHPSIANELGAHCRDRMVQNLLRTSPLLRKVPERDQPALVSMFRVASFEAQDKIVERDTTPRGIFLVASGEVAVVTRDEGDAGEQVVLKTLGPGDVVGEVATLLRRRTTADVVAVHPTVCLLLPVEDFLGAVREHPAILAELYLLAVEREEETRAILDGDTAVVDDFDLV
jgi:cAMP-dependent protein kinase regulator